MVFLMMSGEISFSMVSARQGTGIMSEWRNQLFHGIWAARYWNCVKTVGLWARRNQNVTKTLGFYGGFKRNVWHQRWAKGGLKMDFHESARPCSFPVFRFFFSRCQRSSMSTTSTSQPKPALSHQNLIFFLLHSNGFFDDERRNQLFHDICAARYWNHVKTVGLWAWRNQNVTKTLGFYGGFKRNVWHRRWAKGGLKMVFVSRPGHAVSLFWGFFFQGARGLPCPQFPQVLQNHHYHIKTL